MEDYATDNFAYIIGVMRREDERREAWERGWREFDERRRRERPWYIAAGIVMCLAMLAYCIWMARA